MQRRVVAAVGAFARDYEIYSIDETFLDLAGFEDRDLVAHAHAMREQVLRWTTIPTCVGIGQYQDAGQAGNAAAKKNPLFDSVADLRDESDPRLGASTASRSAMSGVSAAPRRQADSGSASTPPASCATCR